VARLSYSSVTSLDGYVADKEGNFDWAAPDEEVHAFVNELERPIGTYLYGRRMHEVMRYWETAPTEGVPPCVGDFAAIWRAADKVVFSRTLDEVTTERTRLERAFDSQALRAAKASSPHDFSVGGPDLAAQAIAAGLVDEYHLFVTPIVVGGGTSSLPSGLTWELELVNEHRFAHGVVYLHYRSKA
jgi:dihydrofolate reductase